MRFGGPLFKEYDSPEAWIGLLREKGYTAAYCPLEIGAASGEIADYRRAAEKADIVISEVGAWCNPLGGDEGERKAALSRCMASLQLAEDIGARCCVNISGSRGAKWDGPCAQDLCDETFDMIVACVREIIDAVQPRHSFYTLEAMPWMYPDSVDSYLALLKAIGRGQFAVHLDPVNLVNCPSRYFRNGDLLRECFAKLGGAIKSCHAKDILLSQSLTTILEERRPGLGALEYPVFLGELNRLTGDVPLMLEHLPSEAEYDAAAWHIRTVAKTEGLSL